MIRLFFLSFVFLFISHFSFSQTGKITGKIIDSKTGEVLPGATVLIEGTTKGASADFDGNFSLNNVPVGSITLIAQYISYDSKKLTGIKVVANNITNINVQLDPSSSQELQEVVVVVEMNKENTAALVMMQKNNISVSDGVSAETIKRSPDRSTADVLKRVSGVTIVGDKFVVIRGLNDRYNASYLNGSPLPSTEADKKAFAFDIFPANMLDNIIVNKTATPDMPGDFAGGIVQVNTKNIPDKTFISLNIGAGHNNRTTGKTQLTYKGGKYDWLGMDDGSRDLPGDIPENPKDWIKNSQQLEMAGKFGNDWALETKKFSPNFSGQLAAGHNFKLKERDFLGIIFSAGYNKSNNYTFRRRDNYSNNSLNGGEIQYEDYYDNRIYQTGILAGSLLNLSCKITDNNSISLKNMLSFNGDDRVISQYGTKQPLDSNRTVDNNVARIFTSSRIYSSQLIGDHYIAKPKIKINWVGGYSNVLRSVPNARYSSYSRYTHTLTPWSPGDPDPQDTTYKANMNSASTGPDYNGYRFYSKLNEDIRSLKLDISRAFKWSESFSTEFKLGGLYQNRVRTFDIRQFGYAIYNYSSFDFNTLTQPIDSIFDTTNIGKKDGFKLIEITKPSDKYSASSTLYAEYVMADVKYKWFRAIVGVRNERFRQELWSAKSITDTIRIDTTVIDWLPSANLIFNLDEKQAIRFSYSKTVNRPEFRELAPSNWFEPDTRFVYSGNDTLQRTVIHNLDLRYENYMGRGQMFSVSAFYKAFKNPVEMVMDKYFTDQISWVNAPKANLYGAEMEFRLIAGAILKMDSSRFLNNLSLFCNLAYVKSEVTLPDSIFAATNHRPMQGQSPYVINGGVSYVDNDNGFSLSVMVNRIGPRIWIAGNGNDPDKWETGRTVMDIQATKSFLRNTLEIKLTVKDLFAHSAFTYQNGDNKNGFNSTGVDYINFKTTYNRVVTLSAGYKF
jgi:outer membrane receptor for ferrienterochelin and colicin